MTTTVFGNCGVGFAPAKPDEHDFLIQLMEGVEDIPGAALADGITWNWETFPEYLDALEAMPRVMDIAPRSPRLGPGLRHGRTRSPQRGATAADIEAMADIVKKASRPGPSASRHRARCCIEPSMGNPSLERLPEPRR